MGNKKIRVIFFTLLILGAGFALKMRMKSDYSNGQSEKEWKAEYSRKDQEFNLMAQKILDPKFDFYGLELISIGPGEKYYSKFGHVFLRFVGSSLEGKEEDLTVSFLVDANEYNVDNWKGFVGGKYRIYPLIKTMKTHIDDYVIHEKRVLNRFIIPINDEMKAKLKENLRSYIKNRDLLGTWSFAKNSCTNLVNNYLLHSGIQTYSTSHFGHLPLTLVKTMQEHKVFREGPYVYQTDLKIYPHEFYSLKF